MPSIDTNWSPACDTRALRRRIPPSPAVRTDARADQSVEHLDAKLVVHVRFQQKAASAGRRDPPSRCTVGSRLNATTSMNSAPRLRLFWSFTCTMRSPGRMPATLFRAVRIHPTDHGQVRSACPRPTQSTPARTPTRCSSPAQRRRPQDLRLGEAGGSSSAFDSVSPSIASIGDICGKAT